MYAVCSATRAHGRVHPYQPDCNARTAVVGGWVGGCARHECPAPRDESNARPQQQQTQAFMYLIPQQYMSCYCFICAAAIPGLQKGWQAIATPLHSTTLAKRCYAQKRQPAALPGCSDSHPWTHLVVCGHAHGRRTRTLSDSGSYTPGHKGRREGTGEVANREGERASGEDLHAWWVVGSCFAEEEECLRSPPLLLPGSGC